MLLKTGEIEAKNFGYANFIIDASGKLLSFVAIEVQSIDTTGNYQAERLAYLEEGSFGGKSTVSPHSRCGTAEPLRVSTRKLWPCRCIGCHQAVSLRIVSTQLRPR